MSRTPAAQKLIDATERDVRGRALQLFKDNVSDFLKPRFSELAAEQESERQEILARLNNSPNWQHFFGQLSGQREMEIKLPAGYGFFNSVSIELDEPIFHAGTHTFTDLTLDKVICYSDCPDEVKNASKLVAGTNELGPWLNSCKAALSREYEMGWDGMKLSRLCSASPLFRSLINPKDLVRFSINLSAFKFGPRNLDLPPMKPELAEALNIVRHLPFED